ncbi:MAG: DUF3109 family protein [Bacteroidota bacterium]
MFAVGHVLISDDVLDAPFTCNLGACFGGCCVQGESGAPLEPHERAQLEAALPIVRDVLRPEALEVIERDGVWEELEDGSYATTCVGGAECVFVEYHGRVAKCSIQNAYYASRTDFEKPISCHLFPLRIERVGDYDLVNYEAIDLCAPARALGRKLNVQTATFLEKPLTRKYGAAWYQDFLTAVGYHTPSPATN